MGLIVKIPLINVNDESAELISWLQKAGSLVNKGEPLCALETTKSTFELTAEETGILRCLVPSGQFYPIGHPIAFLAETEDDPLPDLSLPSEKTQRESHETASRWTKKAKIVADKLGVDILFLAEQNPDVVISEAFVHKFVESNKPAESSHVVSHAILDCPRDGTVERVLILGGGGGASLALDIMSRTANQRAVGILDNNPAMVGKMVFGTPILGGFELALPLWKDGKFDVLISSIVRDTNERATIYEKFTNLGIPFTNIIDPSVRIGYNATLGQGNLIIYGGYIATETTLGCNNFLAAGTYIEHHSVIGSHCTFGPRTSLSGQVHVGDRVKFGTNVAVEPQLTIGDKALIASGAVLTSHVPPHAVVKNTNSTVLRNAK